MSRSVKHKAIIGYIRSKTGRKAKKCASRKYRHKVNGLIAQGVYDRFPKCSMELTETWDVGGDKRWRIWYFKKVYRYNKRRYYTWLYWDKEGNSSMTESSQTDTFK